MARSMLRRHIGSKELRVKTAQFIRGLSRSKQPRFARSWQMHYIRNHARKDFNLRLRRGPA